MLAGLACCEMLPQYSRSAFQGLCGGHQRGQQQFATQTLRVHLLGIDVSAPDRSIEVAIAILIATALIARSALTLNCLALEGDRSAIRNPEICERHRTPTKNIKVARLQNEVGTRDFFRGTNFLTKNAPKFSPECSCLYFVGLKKSRKIPAKCPAKFPSQKFYKFTDELLQRRREQKTTLSAGIILRSKRLSL